MRKFIVLLLCFAAFLALAVFAYQYLSNRVEPGLPASSVAAEGVPLEDQSPPRWETPRDMISQASEEPSQPEDSPEPSQPEADALSALDFDFTAWDAQGEEVKLSDQLGVPIVLNFWASWCPPCRGEMPDFDKVAAEYDSDTLRFFMVDMIGTNGETREKGAAYIAEEGFAFTVWYDEEQQALYTYGISSFPTTVLIRADGTIATAWAGAVTQSILRQQIADYLGL